jgi:small subunit ribosomal protein S9
MNNMNNMIVTSGKRKQAIARAMIKEGTGKITIRKKDYKFLHFFDRLRMEEPIKIYTAVIGKLNLDAEISIMGGGEKSQIEAARLALAKGMVKFSNSKELTKAFQNYDRNLLVADVRRKEAYKPGDSKARRHRQSSYR